MTQSRYPFGSSTFAVALRACPPVEQALPPAQGNESPNRGCPNHRRRETNAQGKRCHDLPRRLSPVGFHRVEPSGRHWRQQQGPEGVQRHGEDPRGARRGRTNQEERTSRLRLPHPRLQLRFARNRLVEDRGLVPHDGQAEHRSRELGAGGQQRRLEVARDHTAGRPLQAVLRPDLGPDSSGCGEAQGLLGRVRARHNDRRLEHDR